MATFIQGVEKIGIGDAQLTKEGGYAIRVINDTGETSVKGKVVEADASQDFAVELAAGGDIDPFGIIYTAGIPVGGSMLIVVSGIAEVLYATTVTRGTFSRVPTAGEGFAAGLVLNEALPTPPFSTDKHFQEIGHPIESIGAPGLAKTVLHFN